MTGHVRRRGERSWEIKFDLGTDPLTGKRQTRYHSFKGTKREAEAELTRLKAGADRGEYVDPSKVTLSEFLDRWESWAATQVSPKTLERYKEIGTLHVRPRLGASRLQRLRTVDFAQFYGDLQKPKEDGGAGLAPRTVGHVHRLLHQVFGDAVKWSHIVTNPVAAADPPKVEAKEIRILNPAEVKVLLGRLRDHELYPIALIGLTTGMRRGEIVALQWSNIDFEKGRIQVERSLEQTTKRTPGKKNETVLRFKAPKTKAGRRAISIPPSVVGELRARWTKQAEGRLALGLGRANDGLVVPRPDFKPWAPNTLSFDWARAVRVLKLPDVTLHALRHTHVSQLIAAGLDVVTVSCRIGHSSPTVTLNVYAHLFGDTDERASNIVEAAMAGLLTEVEQR